MRTRTKKLILIAALSACTPLGAQPLPEQSERVDSSRIYRIDEVVVTGSNRATQRSLLPYTVSVVGSEQIEAGGQSRLLSALSTQVPGLFVSERNIAGFGVSTGGAGGIKIRGVGGSPTNAVLMMVDGQPQFAGIYSHHVADFYGTENVERVEVLRGPGSVLYGSNAMGGVVNVITKEAKNEGLENIFKGEYGSFNTWRGSLLSRARYGKFSSLVALGYDRTDGVTDDFDFKQMSLYAKAGYRLSDRWQLSADYSLMNFVGNDPVYPRLSDPASTAIYHQNITRGEGSLSLGNRHRASAGNVRVYYSYGNHYIDDPKHFHSLDDRFGIVAYQNFAPWQGAGATAGFDFDTYTGEIPVSGGNAHTPGSLSTIGRKSITEYSPYVTLSQELAGGVVTLNGGLRMANSDRMGTHWIPQGGFALHPGGGWLVKGSVAKGYRNPSFRELYLYKPANPDLDPEEMMNYELTVGHHLSRYLSVDLTAYFSQGDNMIQTLNMKNVNTGSFINKGIELSAESHPGDEVSLRASYSYLRTSLDNLTAAPKNQYFLGASWMATPQVKIEAELRGVGGLYVADEVEHQNYALLNVRMSYRLADAVEIYVNAHNLTNESYVINRGYEMPGFNSSAGVKVNF